MEIPLFDQGPTLGTQAPPVELSGQVGDLAAELGVGWTGKGYLPSGVAPEAARCLSPQQESAETKRVSAEEGPLRHGGSPTKKRRGRMLTPRVWSIQCA